MTCNICNGEGVVSIKSDHFITTHYCSNCKIGQSLERINPLNLTNTTPNGKLIHYLALSSASGAKQNDQAT